MSTLFNPLKVGALTLKNRIIMAPLTRQRAGVERVPNALMAQYYAIALRRVSFSARRRR